MLKNLNVWVKKRLVWVLPLFLGSFFTILAVFLYPLELLEFQTRMQLYFSAVESVDTEIRGLKLHSYVRNECSNEKKEPGLCLCVALLHGLGDNALTWKKLLMFPTSEWRRLGLDRRLKLVAFDLPGSGGSGIPQDKTEYRAKNQARLITEALQPMCNKWVVVGNSLGGWISAWIALDWPEGVERLLLLAPAGSRHSANQEMATAEMTVKSLQDFQNKAYDKPKQIPPWVLAEIARKMNSNPYRDVYAAQRPEDYLDTRLSSVRAPTLFVWGKSDRVIPIEIGKLMREEIRSAVWREIPNCGHLPQKECHLMVVESIIEMANAGSM